MTGILKVDQWKDSGDNALMTSDGAGNLTVNTPLKTSGNMTLDSEGNISLSALTDITYQTTSTNSTAGHHIFKSYNTEIMRVDGGNNRVGIGTSSPNSPLHVIGQTNISGRVLTDQGSVGSSGYGFAGDGNTCMFSSTNNTLQFGTSANERMRINDTGDVLIGTTSTNNNERVRIKNGNDTRAIAFQSASSNECGYIYINSGGTSVTYSTSSDYRLKENVVDLTDASTRVKQLQPKRFNFIADANTTVDGFLAHEVSDIVPEAITGTKDELDEEGNPVYQGIDQSKLVPLLTASLQEAIAKIEELEIRIAALENA